MGYSKHDRIERMLILGVVVGILFVGIGTLGTIVSSTGAPAALTLVGSFITFVSTVILVFFWFFRGDI
jgi:hypothetical protein